MVSTTCRAFSGSVLSRWLLSPRHREGGVLRLVRSIAIKDLVTRLGAALRSASPDIALARCVKQSICIESNAPGVAALHTSLTPFLPPSPAPISVFFSPGEMWFGWLGNISFNPAFESHAYPSFWAQAYPSLHAASRGIRAFALARTSFPSSSRVIESLIQMASLSVTEAEFEGSEGASRKWHHWIFYLMSSSNPAGDTEIGKEGGRRERE